MLVLGIFFFAVAPPGSHRRQVVTLAGPFARLAGHQYAVAAPVGLRADSMQNPNASRLQLLEDGKELGPAHALHGTIERRGAGAFSHWGNQVRLSSSDNSDPNRNGRSYTAAYAVWLPFGWYGVAVVAMFVAAAYLANRATDALAARSSRALFTLAFYVVATAATAQALAWAAIETALAESPTVEPLYRHLCEGQVLADRLAGTQANYRPHHYLNYVLNPDREIDGVREFNGTYHIRRREPIRPRNTVQWRALALGGSTTFGEGITESENWVHQLEKRLRERFGDDCDVINGGVGGYNVQENMIHYLTMLTHLEPDVVILFEGINDVHPRLYGDLCLDYSNRRIPWRPTEREFVPLGPLSRALLPYRYYCLQKHIEPLRLSGIDGFVSKSYPQVGDWAAALQRNGPELYQRNLENLIRLLVAQGKAVVVVPQYWAQYRDTPQGPEARRIFGEGVHQHNRVNEEVSRRLGVRYIREMLADGLFDEETDLRDDCHFTPEGAAKMAEALFAFLTRDAIGPR